MSPSKLFLLLLATVSFSLTACTDSEVNHAGGIIYGGNVIGNGEQTFEIKNVQTIKKGSYLMKGWCYVTNGATLIIEPGTIIKGEHSTRAALIVEPGGRLIAQGTANKPIVFTSEKPAGQRLPGDWGGVILCGNARNNEGILPIEGGPRTLHGGNNDADNSGVLSYVRIEFAGHTFRRNQEINGLTLGSVGSGTQIDHIQVSYADDDAFEWFGGTVNAEYLVAYHCRDDDFDVDYGYRGTCRHLLGVRHPQWVDLGGSHAFECSNNGTHTLATPVTAARFEQATIYGPADVDAQFTNPDELFGAALKLGAHTQVSFADVTVSGYPSLLQGTPAEAVNVEFTETRTPVYPQWTEGWCNFNPQHTAY